MFQVLSGLLDHGVLDPSEGRKLTLLSVLSPTVPSLNRSASVAQIISLDHLYPPRSRPPVFHRAQNSPRLSVIPPCGFLRGLIRNADDQTGFLLCPCNHWPACNIPSVKCRFHHASSSVDIIVQEVKAQRTEPPRAQPCWQAPCHPLPTNLSLHSCVSPLALSHCSLLECSSSAFFSPNNLLLILQNLVQNL